MGGAGPGRGRARGALCRERGAAFMSALGAGRAFTVVIAGVELEVSAAITVPAGDQVRATTPRWPPSLAGGGVPAEQHADRRPAP